MVFLIGAVITLASQFVKGIPVRFKSGMVLTGLVLMALGHYL